MLMNAENFEMHAKRTPSPLTPALSPLRGEGATIRDSRVELAKRAADSPSPLNGERAGVRGEGVRLACMRGLCMVAILLATNLFGADSGSSVIVIYNSRKAESKRVAEYYAQK